MELRCACCYLLATAMLSVGGFPDKVTAQISSDGTLSTTVSTDDAVNFLIEGGERSLDNLFHSFSEFSIPNLGLAYFDNNPDITNIFSRVTGGNISDIQGLIRANGTANLFLINPAGIVFGENASLDVGGSFFATTAESVVFENGIEFSAIEPEAAPLLTVNINPGLQMGANPGNITVRGNGHEIGKFAFNQVIETENLPIGLQVTSGNTIGLLGGEVNLEGGIVTAPAGRIEIGAVDSGVVNLNAHPQGWALNYEEIESFRDINMSQRALVHNSGDGGGDIQVQGGNISLGLGTFLFSDNQGNQAPGVIKINATEALTITTDEPNSLRVFSQTASTGDTAEIEITTPQLDMIGDSAISTNTYNQGNAGDIRVNVTDSIRIDSSIFFARISSSTYASGNAGNITVSTANLDLLDGAIISGGAFSEGNTGYILVNASESINLLGVREEIALASGISTVSFGSGAAGDVTVNTPQLTLLDGGLVGSISTAGGDSGIVTVNATEFIQVQGRTTGENFDLPSTINAALFPSNRVETTDIRGFVPESQLGNSGSLIINTPSLTVTDEAEISVQNFGLGDAGNLQIQTDSLTLDNQGLISAISNSGGSSSIILQVQDSIVADNNSSISADILGDGIGGNIEITTNLLSLNNNARISTNSQGLGQAGNINIFFDRLETNQGLITATSVQSGGGDITLTALGSEIILRDNSLISTSVFDSIGGGGDITINTDLLVSLENSDIRANAVFGQGGNITINTQGLFLSPDSDITASSEFGIDGVVEINTPDEENKLAIAQLPANFTDASEQIAEGCEWTRDNTFYVVGRRGIAKTPQEHIEIYQMWSDIRDLSEFESATVIRESSPRQENAIVEANAMIINEDGKVELVAVVPSNNQNLGQVASSCSGEINPVGT